MGVFVFAQSNAVVRTRYTTSHTLYPRATLCAHPVRGRLEAGLLAVLKVIEHQITASFAVCCVVQIGV